MAAIWEINSQKCPNFKVMAPLWRQLACGLSLCACHCHFTWWSSLHGRNSSAQSCILVGFKILEFGGYFKMFTLLAMSCWVSVLRQSGAPLP